jgi:predicted metal-dependent HD superfamily phosphohydrolase
MTEQAFLRLRSKILKLLRTGLDPRLTYHCPEHTEDVLQQVQRIGIAENVSDERLLLLMKLAALFHDTGFLRTYKGHEVESCTIMLEHLQDDHLQESEIAIIRGMIMATKLPQSPASLPEMIICDADLDYLGRNDFEQISNNLKDEFLTFGIIRSIAEWDQLQVKFFSSHQYFTSTSVRERLPGKLLHLEELKLKLAEQ